MFYPKLHGDEDPLAAGPCDCQNFEVEISLSETELILVVGLVIVVRAGSKETAEWNKGFKVMATIFGLGLCAKCAWFWWRGT